MRDRPTSEVLILMFAATVCFVVVATGATVAILEIRDSRVDTANIVESIDGIVQVLTGAVLGYLARGLPARKGQATPDHGTERTTP